MIRSFSEFSLLACSAALVIGMSGCQGAAMFYRPPNPPEMLGSKVDQLNQAQEENAEASKYVVYQHEFELNGYDEEGKMHPGVRLNEYGQDHLKRVAENVRRGAPYPIVIERSRTSVDPNTEYKYPVHFNPELDMKRREVVVRALNKMGIPDADTRVVVAPAFAEPFLGTEAQMSFARGFSGMGMMGGGGGGGGFGGGRF